MANTVKVGRRAVLRFFDEISEESRGHVTAVNAVVGEDLGVALLKRYLESERGAVVEAIDKPCTQGTLKGSRLDYWVKTKYTSGALVCYQVEIKNWSSTAIGGRELPLDISPEKLRDWKKAQWNRLWDTENQKFRELNNRLTLNKVFEKMLCPCKDAKVEPLACLWWALHPDGEDTPWFDIPINRDACCFKALHVFSMSSYLRNLPEEYIYLDMPDASQRMKSLTQMFDTAG